MPNVAQSTGSIAPTAERLAQTDRTTAEPTVAAVASPLMMKTHCALPSNLYVSGVASHLRAPCGDTRFALWRR